MKEGKNVIVLRTFSKLYGMAGIRMGFAIGRPDLLKKIFGARRLECAAHHRAGRGQGQPACEADLVQRARRSSATRASQTLAWLKSEGYTLHASESNCFMLDVRPARQGSAQAAMAAKEMYIGRIWPAWPNSLRITVGTPDEMMAFRKEFTAVMGSSTAGLVPPKMPRRLENAPFTHLS